MKRFVIFGLALMLIVGFLPTPASATEISEDTAGLISLTCGSIQLQLKKVQKEDSKMRVVLGAKYETVQNNLIINLNLRLVKNNIATGDLTSIQTTFSSEREFFKHAFVDYSKSLDSLIAVNCTSEPYIFYSKLESTREKREAVRASYLRLKDVLGLHRDAVVSLKESL